MSNKGVRIEETNAYCGAQKRINEHISRGGEIKKRRFIVGPKNHKNGTKTIK